MAKLVTILPRSVDFWAPVTTPASIRSMMGSVITSVWMPRSFLSLRNSITAWGIRPMPTSRVDPSSTREAMFSPMARAMSVRLGRDLTGADVVGERELAGLDERLVHGDQDVEVVDADEAVAHGPRHLRVHLGDHEAGVGRRRLDDVHGDAQAAPALQVRRGHLDQSDVDGHAPALEQRWDVEQRDGRVLPVALLDHLPHVGGDEEGVHLEVVGQLLEGVGSLTQGEGVEHLGVGQLAMAPDQSLHQMERLRAARADEDPLSRAGSWPPPPRRS